MNLTTKYLGIELAHPLMVGASPLSDDLDQVRQLEDAGSAAIVMPSLFEEQIEQEQVSSMHAFDSPMESFAEAMSFLPEPEAFILGPDEYVEQVRQIRQAVDLPVIASLNGTRAGRWLNYAMAIEEAGAAALELNNYQVVTSGDRTAEEVENELINMVSEVKQRVKIPVAVKLAPFYSSLANLAQRLVEAGADGLILFNRFFQPDVDPLTLEVERRLHLSSPEELPLRLTWLAILYGRTESSLAATGGIDSGEAAIKAISCGADAVQVVSPVLRQGPQALTTILRQFQEWLEENEYQSLDGLRGALSLERCPDPNAYRRVNYIKLLQSWRNADPDRSIA